MSFVLANPWPISGNKPGCSATAMRFISPPWPQDASNKGLLLSSRLFCSKGSSQKCTSANLSVSSLLLLACFPPAAQKPLRKYRSASALSLPARMVTSTMLRITALLMATTGRTGSTVAYSLALGRGSMGRLGSMGMWTTAMIRAMATMGQGRHAGRNSSTTSRAMRPMTGTATSCRKTIARPGNMLCRGIAAVVLLVGADGLTSGFGGGHPPRYFLA